MEIRTTRFGCVAIEPVDVLHFPAGMLGLDDCTEWVLLADEHNDALGWLQSTRFAEVALAVVSPQRFVPGYQLRVSRSELGATIGECVDDMHVLVIVNKNDRGITLNLKAPLVIDLHRHVGRQVISNGDHPVQYELHRDEIPLRKSA